MFFFVPVQFALRLLENLVKRKNEQQTEKAFKDTRGKNCLKRI